MSRDFALLLGHLVPRDNATSFKQDHAGKTPEEWAVEGRYHYPPSFAAAIVFLAIYILATLINLCQYAFYRAWFWWPMLLGVICRYLNLPGPLPPPPPPPPLLLSLVSLTPLTHPL